MKRYLSALILSCLFFAFAAVAQEAVDDEQEEITVNAFGYPENDPIKIIDGSTAKGGVKANLKPDCDNPKLIALTRETLRPLIELENQSIADKRKTQLVLKNTDNFAELPLKEINAASHRRAAGKILELKINSHIGDDNIKVCMSDNPILSAKLYLVMYDEGDTVRVDIVNFSSKTMPSFIFSED